MLFRVTISKAVSFLHNAQLNNGEYKLYISPDPGMKERCEFDSSPFATAVVLYAISFTNSPQAKKITRQGCAFLLSQMASPGVWSYWTSRSNKKIAQDVDDTACISFVLSRSVRGEWLDANKRILLANRSSEGLFYTWLRDDVEKNDIDSVVNANVLLYLGDNDATIPVCEYLKQVILTGQEKRSYWYYLDDLSLYYAVSRAYFHGVRSLGQIAGVLIEKVVAAQHADGSFGDELLTAMAVSTLLSLEYEGDAVLRRAADYLIAKQREDGTWARIAFYCGPEPPAPHLWWFGSEELTTAFAVEALARYAGTRYSGGV